VGVNIVRRALEEPARQIAGNAMLTTEALVCEIKEKDDNKGGGGGGGMGGMY
jgi:chaperonin GroEL